MYIVGALPSVKRMKAALQGLLRSCQGAVGATAVFQAQKEFLKVYCISCSNIFPEQQEKERPTFQWEVKNT